MSDQSGALSIKFRQIIAPTLVLSVLVASGCSLLNWLLVARSGLVPLDEDVARYWLPLAISWVLVIVLIQPRLRLMKDDANERLSFTYHFAAVAVVAVPTIIAQAYIGVASGGITHLKRLDEIALRPATKHYSVDSPCIRRAGTILQPVTRLTGRDNRTLNFDLYALTPDCGRRLWIGEKLHESHDALLSAADREVKLAEFIRRSTAELAQRDPKAITYFARLGHNADRKGFAAALGRVGIDVDAESTVVLVPHWEAYENRSGNRLRWTFTSFGIAAVLWIVAVLLRSLDSSRLEKRGDTDSALAVLIPRRESYGLPLLVDANVLVFVAMVMSGLGIVSFDPDDLLRWGANYRPALHDFGLLRLVSSQFVHVGIMHLANNLYGLLFAGMFLVPVTGNAGLICCYLIGGLGGSLASAFMHTATVSVGASGAIFGLFGILLVLLLLGDQRVTPVRQFIILNVAVFVGVNLLIGAFSPGIDNAAHVGGLVVGAVLGIGLFVSERARLRRRAT
jgi:membrane associated rhomboid family serine protease